MSSSNVPISTDSYTNRNEEKTTNTLWRLWKSTYNTPVLTEWMPAAAAVLPSVWEFIFIRANFQC